MNFDPATWGTVADWVGGIGTTAAFAATFVVIRRDAKVRRESQARQIAYFLRKPEGYKYLVLDEQEEPVDYFVNNMSPEPIYDVVQFYRSDNALGILDYKDMLLPQQEYEFPQADYTRIAPPLISFRDNSGNMWIRSVSGYVHPGGRKWMSELLPENFNKTAPGLGL